VIIDTRSKLAIDWRVDPEATLTERASIAAHRLAWLDEDSESVARRYRSGELDHFDLIRQYGVIVEWGSGQLLPETTRQHRDLLRKRACPNWVH
jgi:N-methylhydantoinase B